MLIIFLNFTVTQIKVREIQLNHIILIQLIYAHFDLFCQKR